MKILENLLQKKEDCGILIVIGEGDEEIMWKRLSPKARLMLWLIVTCALFLLFLLSAWGVVSLLTAGSRENGTVTFTYGTGSRRDPSVEGKESVYMPRGVAHADFTALSSGCFFACSGDEDGIRYVIQTKEKTYDTVSFFYDSRKAIVNGVHITLEAPVRRVGMRVLVPCTFIETCMEGITVTVSDDAIRVIYDEGGVSLNPSISSVDPPEMQK